MTPERFAALAEAYGGDITRWPDAEREAAKAWLSEHPAADAVLSAERRLDDLLDAWPRSSPSAQLLDRVIAAAPGVRAAARVLRWMTGAGVGLALAGAAACGVAIGAFALPADLTHAPRAPGADGVEEAAAILADGGDAVSG